MLRLVLLVGISIALGHSAFAQGVGTGLDAPADSPIATDAPPLPPTEPPSPPTDVPSVMAPTAAPPAPTPVPPTEPPATMPMPAATATAPSGEAPAMDPAAAPMQPALIAPHATIGAAATPYPSNVLTCATADAAEISLGETVETACAAPGSAAIESSVNLPPCAPVVSASGNTLDFGTSRWNGSAYPTVPGTLTLDIVATGVDCSGLDGGWDIQVSTLAMTRTGGTQTIAPASISYAGSSASGAPPEGVDPVPGPLTLDGAGTIATTTVSNTTGGAWTVAFSLSPPAGAPPGAYTGTITIDVVASSSD